MLFWDANTPGTSLSSREAQFQPTALVWALFPLSLLHTNYANQFQPHDLR